MTLRRFLGETRAAATGIAAVRLTGMTIGGAALVSDHAWLVDQRDVLEAASRCGSGGRLGGRRLGTVSHSACLRCPVHVLWQLHGSSDRREHRNVHAEAECAGGSPTEHRTSRA